MLWNSVGSLVRLACNYAVTIAVVRLSHGFDAAGALALAMAVSNLIMPFADFRLRAVQVTDVHEERSTGLYIALRLVLTEIACLVGVLYAVLTTRLSALPVIALYILYSAAANVLEGLHAVDQRHMRMDYIGRSYILQGVMSLGAFCFALWLTNSLEFAVGMMGCAVVLVGLCYDLPRTRRLESVAPSMEWRRGGKTVVSLFPLVLAQVCSSAVLTIPRQHLEDVSGAAALGIYASVAAPAVIVQMGASYIYSPLLGQFASLAYSDRPKLLRLLIRTVLGIVGIGVGCSVLLAVLGRPLLWLMYGEGVTEYVWLLQPALLCTFVTAFAWFMNDLLLAMRDYVGSFSGNAIAALVTVVISSFLVDRFGMNGVSWVGVASYGVAVLTLSVFFVRDYRRLES